jgi:aquaporin Z
MPEPQPPPGRAASWPLLGVSTEVQPPWARRFADTSREWRRLFAELLGTFMLVLAGAGAPVVDAFSHGGVGRGAAVTAPGLTVMAVILFMGAVSGAHLNPAVSIAFAARGDFPWRRVPGYVLVQLAGATLAVLFLDAMFGRVGMLGATVPGAGIDDLQAVLLELVLTVGLISTILGTASGAQNVGRSRRWRWRATSCSRGCGRAL